MANQITTFSRRAVLMAGAFAGLALTGRVIPAISAELPHITVHKDPNCGCCSGWVEHLQAAGFQVTVIDTDSVNAVKARLRVPQELASCHTAEIAGYAVEGHVPASAIQRLLKEKPQATGLAVPGMPIGSPGMEGGEPEIYDVILFGPDLAKPFARYRGGELV